jgi:hypothetical protein
MVASDRFDLIVGYLVATAKAHHAATGVVNRRSELGFLVGHRG